MRQYVPVSELGDIDREDGHPRRARRSRRSERSEQEDPALTFSDAFYAITTTITASADGMTGNELPISIEDVCDVPRHARCSDQSPVVASLG